MAANAKELYTSRKYRKDVQGITVTCVFVGARDDTFPVEGGSLSTYTPYSNSFQGFTPPVVIDVQGDPSTTAAASDQHRVIVTGRGLRVWPTS